MLKAIIPTQTELPILLQDCGWLAEKGCPETTAWIRHDGEQLHIRFLVMESDPRITCTRMNEPVYTDSCVEFFIQPVAGPDAVYLNFEMNAAGVLLLGKGPERNARRQLSESEANGISIVPSRGVDSENRAFWSISLAIPFSWLKEQVPGFEPVSGAVLKANFYKCGDSTPIPHYGSWSPMTALKPDFHRPSDFGELELA